MKRFYDEAQIAPSVGGYGVLLDGKPVRSPARNPLVVPTAALGQAIAGEWNKQGETIDPATMPLTKLANVVIDGVVPRAADLVESIVSYAETDLICYWAEHPEILVARQARGWRPWIAWVEERFGARLQTTAGIMHRAQSPEALDALRQAVLRFDPWHLGPLHMLTTSSGSLVLALAVAEGALDVEEAFALSEIDDCFQRERWGEDAEAAQRRVQVRADMGDAAQFLDLLKDG